jgi:hypothetical protein
LVGDKLEAVTVARLKPYLGMSPVEPATAVSRFRPRIQGVLFQLFGHQIQPCPLIQL